MRCAPCIKPVITTALPRMHASVTRPSTKHSLNSKLTCTSTFTWKTTFCFLARSRWRTVRKMPAPPQIDFDQRPFVVIWETTQACELACVHCRACAQPVRSALELSTEEAKRLINEVAALEAPVFVLTGGDPLKRPDIFELVQYSSTHGVRISLTPSATPLLTQDAIAKLKDCGLA